MTSSKVQKIEKFVLETVVVLTRFLAQKQGDKNKMIATLMKDNRFNFPKIYRKSVLMDSFKNLYFKFLIRVKIQSYANK
jgi:predicted nucleic-acid-binding protein